MGSACPVTNLDDGRLVIECPDGTSVTLIDGDNGQNGAPGGDGEDGDPGGDGDVGQDGRIEVKTATPGRMVSRAEVG